MGAVLADTSTIGMVPIAEARLYLTRMEGGKPRSQDTLTPSVAHLEAEKVPGPGICTDFPLLAELLG